MENAGNQVETKNTVETVVAAADSSISGSCLVCASGVDPTIGTSDYQEALRDGL